MSKKIKYNSEIKRAYDTEHALSFPIILIGNLMSREFDNTYAKEFGVSIAEWRVMRMLTYRPGISARELCDLTGNIEMTMSRIVRQMEKKRYVRRQMSPRDRRQTEIYLTPKGITIYNQLEPLIRRREKELRATLSASEKRSLNRILKKLIESLR